VLPFQQIVRPTSRDVEQDQQTAVVRVDSSASSTASSHS